VQKARESAILAVETYNRPTATFRSGAYIILMIIAWIALFHALFLKKQVKPFYRKKNSRLFERIDGEPKRWELTECLQRYWGDKNPPARKNLEFFIRLRNRIEHQSLAELDPEIFGECQAILLNFEALLTSEFGERWAVRSGLSYALQFTRTAPKALAAKSQARSFRAIKQYVDAFRSCLSTDVQSSLEYSFKVFLVPKVGNHASGDAIAVEWVKYDPTKPEEMKQYEKIVGMIKPQSVHVANLGFLKPKKVAEEVSKLLGKRFTTYDNMLCYQHFKIRPTNGAADPSLCNTQYCVYDDLHKDYCYAPDWVTLLADKLRDEATYQLVIAKRKKSGQQRTAGIDQGPATAVHPGAPGLPGAI
jgi:hypothetical protein